MKNTIKKIVTWIKRTIILSIITSALILVGYTSFIVYKHYNPDRPSAEEVVAEAKQQIHEQAIKVIEEQKTSVQEAESMLKEATSKLNAEEQKLLDEIKTIKENAEAEVTSREAKIEEINTIRASF